MAVKSFMGWHVLRKSRRLGYGDNRLVRVGKALGVVGEIVICSHGLHASRKLRDALDCADDINILDGVEDVYVCRVRLEDVHAAYERKMVGRRRHCLSMTRVPAEVVSTICGGRYNPDVDSFAVLARQVRRRLAIKAGLIKATPKKPARKTKGRKRG